MRVFHQQKLFSLFSAPNLRYLWTSGRKCNYRGCDRLPRLLPLIRNGWFWTRRFNGRPAPIPDPWAGSCPHCQWSHTGHFGRRQPDNRQMVLAGDDEGWVNGKKYSNTIKSAESNSNYVSNLFRHLDLMTFLFSHQFFKNKYSHYKVI